MAKIKRKSVSAARSDSKKNDILNIASDIFLEKGYARASVNEMYRRSGISKETFYRYFESKEQLFLSVVDKELESYWQGLAILDDVPADQDPRTTLSVVGSAIVNYMFSKRIMAMRQLIFSETENHPGIGELYYNHGPRRAYKALNTYFEKQREKGVRWRVPSKTLAENFVAILLHRITLEYQCGVKTARSKAATKRHTNKVVQDFLDAYLIT